MDETLAKLLKRRPVYAASRMSQLRKSSSAASQLINSIESMTCQAIDSASRQVLILPRLAATEAALDDVRNCQISDRAGPTAVSLSV